MKITYKNIKYVYKIVDTPKEVTEEWLNEFGICGGGLIALLPKQAIFSYLVETEYESVENLEKLKIIRIIEMSKENE